MYDHHSGTKQVLAWQAEYREPAKRQHKDGRIVVLDRRWPLISLFLMLIAISLSTLAVLLALPRNFPYTPSISKRAANESSLLECFQVAAPIPNPARHCQQVLMVHTFALSYGQLFVGKS
jgi:hypothetical protein